MTEEELRARYNATLPKTNAKKNNQISQDDLRARWEQTRPVEVQQQEAQQAYNTAVAQAGQRHGQMAQQGQRNLAQKQTALSQVQPTVTELPKQLPTDAKGTAQLLQDMGKIDYKEAQYVEGLLNADKAVGGTNLVPGTVSKSAWGTNKLSAADAYNKAYGKQESEFEKSIMDLSYDKQTEKYVEYRQKEQEAKEKGDKREEQKYKELKNKYKEEYKKNYNGEKMEYNIPALQKSLSEDIQTLNTLASQYDTAKDDAEKSRLAQEFLRVKEQYDNRYKVYSDALAYDEIVNNNMLSDSALSFGKNVLGGTAKTFNAIHTLNSKFSGKDATTINANSLYEYNSGKNVGLNDVTNVLSKLTPYARQLTTVTGAVEGPQSAFRHLEYLAGLYPNNKRLANLYNQIKTRTYKGDKQQLADELDAIQKELYQGFKDKYTQDELDAVADQLRHNENTYGAWSAIPNAFGTAGDTVFPGLVAYATGGLGELAGGGSLVGTNFISNAGSMGTVGTVPNLMYKAGLYPTIGLSAGSAYMDQALAEGAKYNQGFGYGALGGITEGFSEAVGGEAMMAGLGGFAGKTPLGKAFEKAFGKLNIQSKAGRFIAQKLSGVASESVEEMFSEALNPLWKAITYDRNALPTNIGEFGQYFKNIIKAGIDAVPSSLLMEGFGTVTNAAKVQVLENGIIDDINKRTDISQVTKNLLIEEVKKAATDVKLGLEDDLQGTAAENIIDRNYNVAEQALKNNNYDINAAAKQIQARSQEIDSAANNVQQQSTNQQLENDYNALNLAENAQSPSNEELQQQERNSVAEDAKALNMEQEKPNEFNGYTESEMSKVSSKKISFARKLQDIVDFVKRVRGTGGSQKIYMEKIGKELADRIYNATGFNVLNYNLAIDNSDLNHSNNIHGVEKEKLRGQVPIVDEDYAHIPNIVNNADSIEPAGTDKEGHPLIKFEKTIGDRYRLVNYIGLSRKTLSLKTYYKFINSQKNNPLTANDMQSTPFSTPETTSDTDLFNNSIPPSNNSVNQQDNTQFSLSEKEQKEVNDYLDNLRKDNSLDADFASSIFKKLGKVRNYSDFENIKQEVVDYKDKMYKGISGLEDIAMDAKIANQQVSERMKVRKHTETISHADSIPKEVANKIKKNPRKYYQPQSNQETLNIAKDIIGDDYQKAEYRFLEKEFDSAEDVAVADLLIQKAIADGDYEKAAELSVSKIEKLTSAAQVVQAASMIKRLTPDGMLIYAERQLANAVDTIKKNNPKFYNQLIKDGTLSQGRGKPKLQLTDSEVKMIVDNMEKAMDMEDGREKDVLIAKVMATIGNKIPASALEKVAALRRNGLLANLKTLNRNLGSNATFGALENIKDIPATVLDFATSLITGQRTTSLPNLSAYVKGFKMGGKYALQDLYYGIDTGDGKAGKYEVSGKTFKRLNTYNDILDAYKSGQIKTGTKQLFNRLLSDYEDVAGFLVNGTDRPFWQGRFESELANQMKLDGLKYGTDIPTEQMLEIAKESADYATFKNKNALSKSLGGLKMFLNNGKPIGVADAIGLTFTNVPGSVGSKIYDYTAGGYVKAIKEMYNAASKNGQFNQRRFVDYLARSVTGTGAISLLIPLIAKGIITGSYDDDKDKADMEREMGIQKNAINVSALKRFINGKDTNLQKGDVFYNFDWIQPVSALSIIGANLYKKATGTSASDEEGIISNLDDENEYYVKKRTKANMGDLALELLSSTANQVADMSSLGNFSDLFKGYDGLGGNIIDKPGNFASSFIPTLSNNIAQYKDSTARQTKDYTSKIKTNINKIINKLPGARETLEPKITTLGEEKQQYVNGNDFTSTFLNPGYLTTYNPSETQSELMAVYEATGDKSIFPAVSPGSITYNKETVQMKPKGVATFQEASGQYVSKIYDALFDNEFYQSLEPERKAEILKKVADDGRNVGKAAIGIETSNYLKLDVAREELEDAGIPLIDYYILYGPSTGNGKKTGIAQTIESMNKTLGKDYITTEEKKVLKDIFGIKN